MTAVANPPNFSNLNRPGWINGGQGLNSISSDDNRGNNSMFNRKTIQRTNSSSSVSSTSSNSSTSTVISNAQTNGNAMLSNGDLSGYSAGTKKFRPPHQQRYSNGKAEGATELARPTPNRPPVSNGANGASALLQAQQASLAQQNQMMAQNGMSRPTQEVMPPGRQPILSLLSLNGSFDRKTISVPFYPDTLRIGRQTNAKTVPTPVNGFFDSKVLSRQHAEVWADANGKIWIRDVKSSNGTFVNGSRLSPENRESEPHELQPQDHLELGIDIVSEDQKTVVHHKVAAKVEHAGYANPSNNLMDMSFGELDPSNGALLMGAPGAPPRGRAGSQASANGRMAPANGMVQANGVGQPRQFWMNPITTEHIVKKLHTEMRNARLQNQDLTRTSQFIGALLSKEDIKNMDKPEVPDPPKTQLTNGSISFRSDAGKTRFSEPPAPPPSQPLPEKPDVARNGDLPHLKRGTTERPKAQGTNTSPIRPDNSLNQIMQLTEALNTARRDLEGHSTRVQELEAMLNKEREARVLAEELMQKMEETSHAQMNGTLVIPLANGHSELDRAFDPPVERPLTPEPSIPSSSPKSTSPPQTDKIEVMAAAFQSRIDTMNTEMMSLREQLEAFRQRAEKAELERDADRKTLAEMVQQIRQRDEVEKLAAERRSRSRSKGRSRAVSREKDIEEIPAHTNGKVIESVTQDDGSAETPTDAPTLSRASTIKPAERALATTAPHDSAFSQTVPYASMIGVVLLGMGLMAYLNGGWQQPSRID